MAETPGAMIGNYRIVNAIGSGGFSVVYRAVDQRFDGDVAIKVLADNYAFDPAIRQRFINEGRMLRKVACPAIVNVHDLGENESGQPYLVLGYADAGTLRDRAQACWQQGRQLDDSSIYQVTETLSEALEAVHRNGLVHRDVKPENMLLFSTGGRSKQPTALLGAGERMQLGDFGFAKDLTENSGLTVGGGTVGFSAPEQQQGVGRIDKRADVYGASAVLFWLLTRGDTPAKVSEHPQNRLTAAGVSPQLAAAVAKGLGETPDRRQQTIEEWHNDIAACLQLGGPPHPAQTAGYQNPAGNQQTPVQWQPATTQVDPHANAGTKLASPGVGSPNLAAPPPQSDSKLLPLLAVGAIVLAGIIGAGYFFTRESGDPSTGTTVTTEGADSDESTPTTEASTTTQSTAPPSTEFLGDEGAFKTALAGPFGSGTYDNVEITITGVEIANFDSSEYEEADPLIDKQTDRYLYVSAEVFNTSNDVSRMSFKSDLKLIVDGGGPIALDKDISDDSTSLASTSVSQRVWAFPLQGDVTLDQLQLSYSDDTVPLLFNLADTNDAPTYPIVVETSEMTSIVGDTCEVELTVQLETVDYYLELPDEIDSRPGRAETGNRFVVVNGFVASGQQQTDSGYCGNAVYSDTFRLLINDRPFEMENMGYEVMDPQETVALSLYLEVPSDTKELSLRVIDAEGKSSDIPLPVPELPNVPGE